MDALHDFERLKRKCESECFNNELVELKKIVNENDFDHSRYTEFLNFILENAETEWGDERKTGADPAENSSRIALQQQHHHDGNDQVVPKNMTLEIQIAEGGEKGGTSNPVSKRPRSKAQGKKKKQTKSKGVNENRAPASQPGVKVKTQWQMNFPEFIKTNDEDDDDDNEVSSPHGRQAGRQGKKDKGKRVVSENPAEMQRNVVSNKGILISPFVPLKRYHESVCQLSFSVACLFYLVSYDIKGQTFFFFALF